MERREVKPRRREESDEATHQRRGGEGEGGALLRGVGEEEPRLRRLRAAPWQEKARATIKSLQELTEELTLAEG